MPLQNEVDWEVGDQIVIATTNNFHSKDKETVLKSNEVMTISAISAGKKVLTLTGALVYQHLSTVYEIGYKGLVLRKEVLNITSHFHSSVITPNRLRSVCCPRETS